MLGIDLISLKDNLCKVPAHKANKPSETIKDTANKLCKWGKYISSRFGEGVCFLDYYYRLPIKAFESFSFDELCKLQYSSIFMMEESVRELFETDTHYEIIRKIKSSMWRWDFSPGNWNEIVDAYNNIRNFSFVDNPNVEIRLDYTTYYNQYGYSKFARVFLDGVFGFLIYYKGEHVLTIGFSILSKKRILIQQIQSAKVKGNRFLYTLPQNKTEFVLDIFLKNFPGYKLFLINGSSLVKKTISDYKSCLSVSDDKEQKEYLKNKIKHLTKRSESISVFYSDTGRHSFSGKQIKRFNLVHCEVII